MIELKKIYKSFDGQGHRVEIFEDMNLQIPDSGVFAVKGKSGSGKTTFLSLLAGLDSADSGEILIDGQDLQKMTEKTRTDFRSKNIGIVFQDFHLFPFLTVKENIALPLQMHKQNNIEEEVLAMAQLLGLEHRLDFYPTTLSGGEKQRVAIGRAFIARPHIILADEPTGNLDTETGERISNELIEMAHKLNQNLIIVTHDDELAAKCDKTYVLANKAIS